MGNENPAGKLADGNGLTGQRRQTPAATPRLGPLGLMYGIGTWLQFVLATVLVLPVLLLTPSLSRRRAQVSGLARLALRLAGMRLELHGLEQLPQPCIVVANHSSYLDGVVLAATLPPCFSFVIKREMSAVPLAGTLLRRIGAEFVERGDRIRGARDARRRHVQQRRRTSALSHRRLRSGGTGQSPGGAGGHPRHPPLPATGKPVAAARHHPNRSPGGAARAAIRVRQRRRGSGRTAARRRSSGAAWRAG
jgi:1-acyl-sn-glycerol-3-phosphate acyltransferase